MGKLGFFFPNFGKKVNDICQAYESAILGEEKGEKTISLDEMTALVSSS